MEYIKLPKLKVKLFVFIFALSIIFILGFAFVDQWLIIQDKPEKADIIICLGGGSGERLQKAVELYKKDFAPLILIGDPGWSDPEVREFFLEAEKQFLVHKGIPPESILKDPTTDSTFCEALHARDYMSSHGLHSALVISDPYHMRRVKYAFKKVFQDENIKLIFVPAKTEWA